MKDRNIPHSVAVRLLQIAHAEGVSYEYILLRYGAERLLYRLSCSDAADRFLLKGANLFLVWSGQSYRPTRDIDLLGYGPSEPSALEGLFRTICQQDRSREDGLVFQQDSVRSEPIREGQDYEGVRIRLRALLQNARIDLQIDIGFGDLVVPAATITEFPTLLDAPAPRMRMYPRETAFAEKLQTIVARGLANSRLKDYLDLWMLSSSGIDEAPLIQTIRSTFNHRGTPIPENLPPGLTPAFAENRDRSRQWAALAQCVSITPFPESLDKAVSDLALYVSPLFSRLTAV